MGKSVRSQGWVWILVWPTTVSVTSGKSLPSDPVDQGSEALMEGGFTHQQEKTNANLAQSPKAQMSTPVFLERSLCL